MSKQFTLGDFFSSQEIKQAQGKNAGEIYQHIVNEEKIEEINKLTKQENDRHYWSYLLEYYLTKLVNNNERKS